MLLIGSVAARHHFPDFRKPQDMDLLGTPEEVALWVEANRKRIASYRRKRDHKLILRLHDIGQVEIEIVKPGSSSDAFMKLNQATTLDGVYVASPTSLMLIKLSHLRHPIHWRKNIEDYHFLKARAGAPTQAEREAYLQRRLEVDIGRQKRRVNLNMTNEQFFEKSSRSVRRIYDHDDLHRATCYYDVPLYETLKRDKDKAMIDKDLFDAIPHADQLRAVREECYAIALERVIIPAIEAGRAFDPQGAFLHALQRVCTTLTKGWFREFAIDHYPEIKDVDRDFVGYFLDAVNDGKIRRIVK